MMLIALFVESAAKIIITSMRRTHTLAKNTTPRILATVFFFTLLTFFLVEGSWLHQVMLFNDELVSSLGQPFLYVAFAMVLLLIGAIFSPLGKVRIGGVEAKRDLPPLAFSCVCLCTTVGSGILYWGAAEPLQHKALEQLTVHPLALMFFHWGFTPYAIFLVFGLTFALCLHNRQQPTRLASCLSPLRKNLPQSSWVDFIDALLFFSLIAGVSSAIGAGVLAITSSSEWLFAFSSHQTVLLVTTLLIGVTFTLSALSGVTQGIRVLSEINVACFIVFLLYILFFTDSASLLSQVGWGLRDYLTSFLSLSIGTALPANMSWQKDWTLYFWSSWMTWAPVVGLFLGQIARGYTVRHFLFLGFFLPSLGSLLWMAILGGASLSKLTDAQGVPLAHLLKLDPQDVIYPLLVQYPLPSVALGFFIFICFISLVTAADSNTVAMEKLCTHGPGTTNRTLPLVWGILISGLALVTISDTGVKGIRLLTRLGGVPALLMSVGCCLSLGILLWEAWTPAKKA